jgi:elongation factor G
MGELHLEILISRLKREFGTQVNVGRPQVVYKETIEQGAQGIATFEREVGGVRHFGHVVLELSPRERGTGNRFTNALSEEQLPAEFVSAAQEGVMESMESGVVLGYPVVDVAVCLVDARYKESEASYLAFKVAASMACKDGLQKGSPQLLEPIVAMEILAPEAFMGDIMGDVNARGGKIEALKPKGGIQTIEAIVPLSRTFGYSTALRSATQGRGTFTMRFSHYDKAHPAP